MVCLGNICRSPLAQGIAERIAKEKNLQWEVDSAGTSAWHLGEAPDHRSIQIAKTKGIDISDQCARQIGPDDIKKYDLILAMDSENYNNIKQLIRDEEDEKKLRLIMDYVYPGRNMAVPDPYFDGNFERVYELLYKALDKISEELV